MKGWWRRQRWAMLALPLVVVLAVVANSSRINDYWWSRGLHQPVDPDAAGVVHLDDAYDDGFVRYPITADVSLRSLKPVTALPGSRTAAMLPDGAMLWQVALHFDADPDVSMTGCTVELRGDDGTTYDADNSDYDGGGTGGVEPVHLCAPDDTPGPQFQLGSGKPPSLAPGQPPRPRSYDTIAYVVTPTGARPTEVRVWWLPPTYARLPVG